MTIIFKEDWNRYPTAIPDFKTKNRSFVRLAQLYKSMGVENHLFHLALLNPEIQGLDPYDPNLTREQKAAITIECKYNIWYFMREVVRIAAQAGSEPNPLRANRGNISLFWSYMNHVMYCLIQPRQTGKSISSDSLATWLMYSACENTTMLLFTKDNGLRVKNIERLKKMVNAIPRWISLLSNEDADNQTTLTCKARANVYNTAVAQSNEEAALKTARGFTMPNAFCDETPFVSYAHISIPAMLAAAGAAREEAAAKGEPYGTIFTTTAGKKDDVSGRYMYNLLSGGVHWSERFLDAKNLEELQTLIDNSKTGLTRIINGTFNHRQLGYSDEWLLERLAESTATGDAADRDFFSRWTSGTESSPIPPELAEKIREAETEPYYTEVTSDLYMIRWYIARDDIASRMANGRFIAGMDTSDAIGRDATAIVVVDVVDLSVVACITINNSNLLSLANMVGSFLIKYPTVTLIMERKSTASTILDTIALQLIGAGFDPYKRIYNSIVNDHEERRHEFQELARITDPSDRYNENRRHFGFNTDHEKRKLLYGSVLQGAVHKAPHVIYDRPLIMELLGLVIKDGRIDHKASGHDDHCIAFLLAHWLITYGKNLRYYGIEPNKVMSMVTGTGEVMTPEVYRKRKMARLAQERIEGLLGELKECDNEFMLMKLEHQIQQCMKDISNVDMEAGEALSAMVESVKEQRVLRARHRRPIEIRRNNRARVSSFDRHGNRVQLYG